MNLLRTVVHWLTGPALLLFVGCSSPEPRYYVMSAPAGLPPPGVAPISAAGAVGLGPLRFPGYLDRPQIVTRSSQNELELAEFERWAEPLKDNAAQVVADGLSQALGGRRVVLYPWKRATPITYQVTVDVKRFDRTRGAESELAVRWNIQTGDGQRDLLTRDGTYVEWPADEQYATTVATMNRSLLKFSRELAAAIRALEGAGQAQSQEPSP